MSERMMENKVVVVTGSGGGLGREFATALARHGAKLVINDVGASLQGEGASTGPAESVAKEIAALGGMAAANTDSVATPAGAAKIVQCALDNFGRIDGVINNAGNLRDRLFHKMEPEEWDAVIAVHLMGSFYVSRAAAPHFRQQESGAYLHITSNTGLIGNVGQANYAAAKGGIVSMSKAIALEMARYKVRSNCLAPAAWTRMLDAIPADTPEKAAKAERLKAKMAVTKVSPLAVYLLSDQASEVNGQVFHVRSNEIFVYSQPRPVRSMHRSEGWTPETIASQAIPALKSSFVPVEHVGEVFPYEPV